MEFLLFTFGIGLIVTGLYLIKHYSKIEFSSKTDLLCNLGIVMFFVGLLLFVSSIALSSDNKETIEETNTIQY